MWFVIGLIVLIFLLIKNSKEGFQESNFDTNQFATAQQDFYTNYHKYPFTKYSLYGYDDYSPYYRNLWEQEKQNPFQIMKEKEWQITKDRRRNGKDYIQMPSYNHVRQLGYTN